ncbi:MAG: DNA polymerase III subunit chi [Cohaesibacteraceae bacterium]
MVDVAFYHLQAASVETALPQLLGKCLERHWRAVVEVGDHEKIGELDDHLWTFSDQVFLPHASTVSANGVPEPTANRQPIWITGESDNPNKADVRFFVSGALPPDADPLDAYQRVILMFDGNDGTAVAEARQVWKRLRDAGHSLSYWQQTDSGGWKRADNG